MSVNSLQRVRLAFPADFRNGRPLLRRDEGKLHLALKVFGREIGARKPLGKEEFADFLKVFGELQRVESTIKTRMGRAAFGLAEGAAA